MGTAPSAPAWAIGESVGGGSRTKIAVSIGSSGARATTFSSCAAVETMAMRAFESPRMCLACLEVRVG